MDYAQPLLRPLVLRDDASANHLYDMAHALVWDPHNNHALPIAKHVRETTWNATNWPQILQMFGNVMTERVDAPPAAAELRVHLTSDRASRSHGVSISGRSDDAASAETLWEFFVGVLNPFGLNELLDQAASPTDLSRRGIGLVRLGMGAPLTCDADILGLFAQGFYHEHPGIRNAAVWACRWVLWPELFPLLREMQQGDPEEELRSVATDVIILHSRACPVDPVDGVTRRDLF